MKKTNILAGLLLVSAGAWACTNYEFVGELFIGTVDSRADVAEELQEQYGDQFPEGTRVEASVRFILRSGGITVGTFNMPIVKECDETLEEAYEAQISTTPPGGGGSGGGYYFPGFPNIPGGCIGNCGGTVTVGEVETA